MLVLAAELGRDSCLGLEATEDAWEAAAAAAAEGGPEAAAAGVPGMGWACRVGGNGLLEVGWSRSADWMGARSDSVKDCEGVP